MKTVENVFKLIMQEGVQVEKDYGWGVDIVPWAADTRQHATMVFAKNMKAFSWCMCVYRGIPDDTACLPLTMFLMDPKDEGVFVTQ